MLVRLYFLQNVLVFVLSVEIERSHHLLEQIDVNNLIAFAASEAQSFVEENLKCLDLILQNFSGLQMLLCHVSFCDIGSLIASDKVQIEHKLIILIVSCKRLLRTTGFSDLWNVRR
jgi:hypothetical protein